MVLDNKAGSVLINLLIIIMKTKSEGKPPTTYINASEIQFSGIKQQFIATMAPKPNTVQNFWHMVIEKKVFVHIKDRL